MNISIEYDTTKHMGLLSGELLPLIREHFSVEDKASTFKNRRTVGYKLPTRKYLISPQGRFEIRMIKDITEHIRAEYPTVTISISDDFTRRTALPELQSDYTKLNLPLRDYQEDAVVAALENREGVIVLPTSAGKTLVIATIALTSVNQLKTKALVLVPDIQLVSQTYSDLLEYGIDPSRVTRWTGSYEPDRNADIIIANAQILLSKAQDTSLVKQAGVLIVDECHKLKSGNKINKFIKKLPARTRFGLTGSFPDPLIDQWAIKSLLGPIIITRKSAELRKQKYISDVQVAVLRITYSKVPVFTRPSTANPTAGHEDEIQFLHTSEFRNNTISRIAGRLENNTLILVDRISHGEHLLEYLQNTLPDKHVCFIQGSVEVEEREKLRALMETQDNIVCVAISKIFSTGLNIKNLHHIIFAAIGKARIKIIQSIGRSLRLHKNKQIATIYDIGDNLYYSNKHLLERLELYRRESIPVITKTITQL